LSEFELPQSQLNLRRRHLLGAGSAALAAFALPGRLIAAEGAKPAITPMRATADRLIDISVCLRPFRLQGPRIEAERRHGKTIVHHYGHGGSGWSLSWGSARTALPLVLATKAHHIAVIGCGAIGLTTAIVAQRAGLRVRIYCKDRPPEVSSSGATGLFTPDSRIVTSVHATPQFIDRWAWMARNSFKTFQSLLGLASQAVEWRDGYVLSDLPFGQAAHGESGEPDYPELFSRIADLQPRSVPLAAHEHAFRVEHVRRFTQMTFNISSYQRQLMDEFMRDGGEIVHREFTDARQFAGLAEHTIVNCTGYGARALFGDQNVVPVRGQTARLIPQPEVDYAVIYRGHNLLALPRRDGILVQAQGEHDYGNEDMAVDRALSEAAVQRLAALFATS
jgi:glycine/D-amino acid oxidase-like deaminating enzyme